MEIFNSRIPAIINLFSPCVEFTFGQLSWFRNSKDCVSWGLRLHAKKHRDQFKHLGVIGFCKTWLRQLFTVGYRNIDLELEARAAEKRGL